MTALPPSSDFTAVDTTEGEFKAAITELRSFLAGLLGTDGTKATALATLGAFIHGTMAKSAEYTVLVADRGKFIDCTTGTWALTLPVAAAAGDGFVVAVRNSGDGVIAIEPNGTEQIDGADTVYLDAGESCFVVGNGSEWKTVSKVIITPPVDQSQTESGYTVLPGGIIIQWGTHTGSGDGNIVTFPIEFPTQCLLVNVSNGDGTANANAVVSNVSNNATSFTWRSSSGVATRNNWIAIGF